MGHENISIIDKSLQWQTLNFYIRLESIIAMQLEKNVDAFAKDHTYSSFCFEVYVMHM